MIRRVLTSRTAVASAVVGSLALVGLWALPGAIAQDEERAVGGGAGEASEIEGLGLDEDILKQSWVDPIIRFKLGNLPLASEPSFDFTTLNQSDVFESGVENLPVDATFDVSTETDRHLRALQAVATVEDAIWSVGQEIAGAEASITQATRDIAANRDQIEAIDEQILDAQLEIDVFFRADQAEIAEQDRLFDEIGEVNGAVAELAIQAFIGETNPLEDFLEDPQSSERTELRVVTDELRDFQRDDIDILQAQIRESEERREELADELAPFLETRAEFEAEQATLEEDIERLIADRNSFRASIADLEEEQVDLEADLELTEAFTEVTAVQYQAAFHQRLTGFVRGTNIPLVALNAYVRASRTLAVESSGCGIHWSQLAGIGRIESVHGHFGDSTLDWNGNTTVDILGIQLNGTNNTAVIRDSDDGVLDGDPVFDRAVGPMQFIPTTWDIYGSDGNGDGESDPVSYTHLTLPTTPYV